jgi:hypothetical protein
MKQPKTGRVPVIENAFEINLPALMRAAKVSGEARFLLDDGVVRTVVVLTAARLAAFLGGQTWLVDIEHVQCLKGRVRPLLKCPRTHEGNFQSLYWFGDELACRQCHRLRYRSTLAASPADRARMARIKLLTKLGAEPSCVFPARQPFKWRKRHRCLSARLVGLTGVHYRAVRGWLQRHAINADDPVKQG